jgi:hypothetical protein
MAASSSAAPESLLDGIQIAGCIICGGIHNTIDVVPPCMRHGRPRFGDPAFGVHGSNVSGCIPVRAGCRVRLLWSAPSTFAFRRDDRPFSILPYSVWVSVVALLGTDSFWLLASSLSASMYEAWWPQAQATLAAYDSLVLHSVAEDEQESALPFAPNSPVGSNWSASWYDPSEWGD